MKKEELPEGVTEISPGIYTRKSDLSQEEIATLFAELMPTFIEAGVDEDMLQAAYEVMSGQKTVEEARAYLIEKYTNK